MTVEGNGVLVPSHLSCQLAQCFGTHIGNEMEYNPDCLGPDPFGISEVP